MVNVLLILLAVAAGLVWSARDQSEYADILDHGGLSATARVYPTKSGAKISSVVYALAHNPKIDNIQVQFGVNKTTSYIYEKGQVQKLPLDSGQFFSTADYNSTIPVAVVGRTAAENLYVGSNQKYLQVNGQYLSVIGVIGSDASPRLNNHVFINASARGTTYDPELKNVEVLVDTDNWHSVNAPLKRILGATSYRHLSAAKTQVNSNRDRHLGVYLTYLALITLGLVLVAALNVWLTPAIKVAAVDRPLRYHYLFNMVGSYLPGAILALAVGTGIAWWRFYITNYIRLVGSALVMLAIFTIANQILLYWRLKRKEHTRAIT
ncbi:membrane protein [Lacticaseibacillus thailandensis DSM 22698 = JCM 13996]|uniref:Membrane protein n=1 Tax=Lacticaseibacillus thailandensis DSM 22698 = JCM 13996 TaxID=1423810 RepID=A0A0R2CI71_9LACO|nr:membrane protein [Lacticaseibacillus thailandensis DSM 22698 = JCM 13996]